MARAPNHPPTKEIVRGGVDIMQTSSIRTRLPVCESPSTVGLVEPKQTMSQIVVKPTFLLKGIDPVQMAAEYSANHLAALSINGQKVVPVNLTTNRGKSFRDAIYAYRNHDNFLHTIATTSAGCSFDTGAEDAATVKTCLNCRRSFTHHPIGIPVNISTDAGVITIHTLHTLCDFRCALAATRLLRRIYRNTHVIHSEEMLHFVYRRMHPNGPPLIPAWNPFLLEANGGSITFEEYDDRRYEYVEVPNLLLYPAREQYMRFQKS